MPNRPSRKFLDLSAFALGLDALQKVVVEEGGEDLKAHMSTGITLYNKYGRKFYRNLFTDWVHPTVLDKGGVMVQPTRKHDLAMKKGIMSDALSQTSTYLHRLFPWLIKNHEVKKEMFEGKGLPQVVDLARIASEEAPKAQIKQLAELPSISRLRLPRTWLQEAAALIGQALDPMEKAISDAETAAEIGEQIREAKNKQRLAEPMSPEAAEAQAEVSALLNDAERLARSSDDPQGMRLVSAQAAAKSDYTQATRTGAKLGMSQSQERAMLAKGKTIIAAGAGSGKSRVVAGKVVYHVVEEGIPIDNIIATSFSKKSAAELKSRIREYGAPVEDSAKNIGTTHSVALSILREFDPEYTNRGGGIIDGRAQSKLVRIAMAQVRMRPGGGAPTPPPPPADEDFFPTIAGDRAEPPTDGDGYTPVDWSQQEYQYQLELLRKLWLAARQNKDSWTMNFAESVGKQFKKKKRLSPKQIKVVNDKLRRWKVASTLKMSSADKFEFERRIAIREQTSEQFNLPLEGMGREAASGANAYYNKAAGQWFNLGWPTVSLTGYEDDGSPKVQKIGPKRFSTGFGRFRANLKSPGAVWSEVVAGDMPNNGEPYVNPEDGISRRLDGSYEEPPTFEQLCCAVYGAYMWLKDNLQEYKRRNDFTDMQVRACALAIQKPDVRKALNDRYKVIMVDEAQDLNQLQHLLFGLIAGYIDPDTLEPNADGSMTADTYALVGDDKQAIYAFRGADPQEFVSRSDLDGGDFKSQILEVNYRSGGMIVGAANNLIAHNKITDPETGEITNLQIPMICNVKPSAEGKGVIEAVPVESPKAAAADCAESIRSMLDSGWNLGKDGESPTFGIGLRTNAEAYAYCAELAKRSIPFRSRVDLFGNATTKMVLDYLNIATSNDDAAINEAVLRLHRFPDLKLGRVFGKTLKRVAKGSNYYDWLVANWTDFPWKRSRRFKTKALGQYVENLRHVRENLGTLDPDAFLERLFSEVQGYDEDFNSTTLEQSLIEAVRQNEDKMDMLSEQSTDNTGAVSDTMILEEALAPVGLVRDVLDTHGDIGNAMTFIDKLQKLNEKNAKSDEEGGDPAVLVSTAHGWKGLACEHMFTQMAEGIFPSYYAQDDLAMAQERRLAYVTITRGKNNVTIYSPEKSAFDRELKPSRFVREGCVPGLKDQGGPQPLGPDEMITPDEFDKMYPEEPVRTARDLEIIRAWESL